MLIQVTLRATMAATSKPSCIVHSVIISTALLFIASEANGAAKGPSAQQLARCEEYFYRSQSLFQTEPATMTQASGGTDVPEDEPQSGPKISPPNVKKPVSPYVQERTPEDPNAPAAPKWDSGPSKVMPDLKRSDEPQPP